MHFVGRSSELGQLRSALDATTPRILTVSGPPGMGVSTLVRRALEGTSHVVLRCPPLPDAAIRGAIARQLDLDTAGLPGWTELLDEVFARAPTDGPALVLALDDAQHLSDARARFLAPALAMLVAARAEGRRVHLLLAGRAGALPDVTEAAAAREIETTDLRVGGLSIRAALPHLPGSRPHEKIRAWSVFGGTPAVLAHLDTSVTVGTNVRRLLLADSGALADLPLAWLERAIQTPTRYVAILAALSRGEAEWSHLAASIPDLTRSGQVAPYLNRLSDLGLVETRRSLDAAPRSRSTRYRIRDPFVAFWFRFILPWRSSERSSEIVPWYASQIRPGIRDHAGAMLPALCRRHLEESSIETFGSTARDIGSLWSNDMEIEVAATLSNGAVCYGTCLWDPPSEAGALPESPLQRLDHAIRETRYGFGRQNRQRLVFTGRSVPTWLRREVARRHDAQLIDASELVGSPD